MRKADLKNLDKTRFTIVSIDSILYLGHKDMPEFYINKRHKIRKFKKVKTIENFLNEFDVKKLELQFLTSQSWT